MIKRNQVIHKREYIRVINPNNFKFKSIYLYYNKRLYIDNCNKDGNAGNKFKESIKEMTNKINTIIKDNKEKLQNTSLINFDNKTISMFSSLPEHFNKITGYDKIEKLKADVIEKGI